MHDATRGSSDTPFIELKSVSHSYAGLPVMTDFDLTVHRGEFVSIVGPTGCGKSTILNLLAGLEAVQGGSILVDQKKPHAGRPGTGYAFPRDAMLPWRTAIENVALPLELAGVRRASRLEQAEALLRRVGLAGRESSYRSQLSQGMRQRVALARTLITEPTILFMDEPFAALDAQTRVLMQRELLLLLEGGDKTVVFITHDLDEAISLSDTVVVLSRRPCRIVEHMAITFPRPRSVVDLRLNTAYQDVYGKLWEALRHDIVEE